MRRSALADGLLFATCFARTGAAYEAKVDATFDAQYYQLTSPFGDPVLRRRRYTQTLSLRVHDMQGDHDPGGPQLDAIARLRLDTDLGIDPREQSPFYADQFVPGLQGGPVDIMMAYVEGRNYFGGLGFRLGRQYVVDALGFWSFDGGMVRVVTPAYVTFEAYGGFEQRGGLPMLATSRFEADGVYRGSRRNFSDDLWPAYLNESKLAPAYGFAVESSGLDWLSTRLTYRKVVNRDTVIVAPYADADGKFATYSGDRVSTERVGWAGTATAANLGALRGEFVYDLYALRFAEYGAAADLLTGGAVDAGVRFDYFLPTFDADSIFNWFEHFGTTTLEGRVVVRPVHQLSVAASAGARRFVTQGTPGESGSTLTANRSDKDALYDVLARVDGVYRLKDTTLTLVLSDEHGDRGYRRGGDFGTRRVFMGNTFDASALLSLYAWSDTLRPDRDTTSLTYVLGGGFRPSDRTRLGVQWEHTMNELVGERFRALCTLDLTVL